MAKQSFQLDPEAGGVSQAVFDVHRHNYDKRTGCAKSSLCDPVTHTVTQTDVPA